MLVLNVLIPGKEKSKFFIKDGTITVGSLDDVDVCIKDSTVSRKHCLLEGHENRWILRDLGSKNGIIIEGEKVKEFEIKDDVSFFLGRVSISAEVIPDSDGLWGDGKKVIKVPSQKVEKTEEIFFGPELSLLYFIKGLSEENSYQFFETINKYLFECSELLIGEKKDGNKNSDEIPVIYLEGNEKTLLQDFLEIPQFSNDLFYLDNGKYFLVGRGKCRVNQNIFNRIISIYEKNFVCEKEKVERKDNKKECERKFRDRFHFVSKKMKSLLERVERISKTDISVLILGESGVGKELLASFIHENSKRKNAPFIAINCAAVPDTLIEAELFGVEKGAATDTKERPGKFEMADGGTLFLDEISNTSLSLQAKLLRAIQFKEFYRVGGTDLKKVDVRIIVATNKDLSELMDRGEFRRDLYYRLAVDEIYIPPLRERREDIPELIDFFIKKFSLKYQKHIQRISARALQILMAYDFPGNVRELENEIERAVALVDDGDIIREAHLSDRIKNKNKYYFGGINDYSEEWELAKVVEDIEKNLIIRALNEFKNKKEVARALKISRTTLDAKIKKYGIGV